MPGAGKSTLGVLLAKALGYDFIDTDIILQKNHGAVLPDILKVYGYEGFIEQEEQVVLDIECAKTVIAPGGSVVYSQKAMEHLRRISYVVYLELSLERVKPRLSNITTRGVLLRPGQDIDSLYAERVSYYTRYAHQIIKCDEKNPEQILNLIIKNFPNCFL